MAGNRTAGATVVALSATRIAIGVLAWLRPAALVAVPAAAVGLGAWLLIAGV